MATVPSSAGADDAHAAWGDPGDSQPSSRLTASPGAIVESRAACPDRLRTRLPSVAGTCRVQRPAAATCPVRSSRRSAVRRRTAARGLAQRAVETAVFDRTKNRAERNSRRSGGTRPVGGVARDAAPSCAGAATNPDRRGRARTASGARVFRPSATAREARPLAAVAPADISAPAIWEMASVCFSLKK